jgi:hypothetical protein
MKMSKKILKIGGLSQHTATIKGIVGVMFILFLCNFISSSWTSNLNSGLTDYWTNNQANSTGNGTYNNITQTWDKNIYGSTFAFGTGILGNMLNFTDTATRTGFATNNRTFNYNISFTENFWIKGVYDNSAQNFVWGTYLTKNAHDDDGIQFIVRGNGTIIFNKNSVGTVYEGGNITLSNSTWYMITIQNDGIGIGTYRVYINGVLGYAKTRTGSDDKTAMYSIEKSALTNVIPKYIAFDEHGRWNRTITEAEITQLYNGGTGIEFVSNIPIKVELVSPSNNSKIGVTQTNLSANYTSSLYDFVNSTYYVWYNNGTLFNSTTLSLTGNITNSSQNFTGFAFDDYIWNVRACVGDGSDFNCTFAPNNYTFSISPFSLNNVSYPISSLETSIQLFHINISAVSGISSVTGKFWINGTARTANVTDGVSGIYKSYDTIDMPLNNITSNMTFLWQFDFTFSDSSTLQQNSSSYSTQVNRTILQICNATYPYPFINFTTKSATNPFPLVSTTFKTAWNYWIGSGSVSRNYTYEDMNEILSSFAFCGSPNTTFYTNAHIEYDAGLFALNSYFLSNASLNNITNNISLYLLNNSLASVTVLRVVDNGQHPIEDVEIQILFYDVGTGTYYTVGIASTDFLGQDVVYLNWYDSLYKFILTQNGVVIKSTNTTKISETPVTFEIKDDSGFIFDKFSNFQYNLYFNDITSNFVLTFVKPSGEVDTGCLRVIKRSLTNDTQICNICEESSSATLYCDISSYGNGTYVAAFYATGSIFYADWITKTIGSSFAEEIYGLLGNKDGTFYMFMITGLCLAIFFVSPIFGIIGIMLGLGAGYALGFNLLNYGEFIGLLLLGGIIIWLIKR